MDHFLDQTQIADILGTWGYFAIFLALALECAGLPLPGETILIGAAIYAGQTGELSISYVILAAAAGAILGDNIGYWVGRRFGAKFLDRYARRLGFAPERLLLLRYLFARFGGWIVLLGRFVTLLRILAALLAGASRMPPTRFFFFNALGGVAWAAAIGLGGYYFTYAFKEAEGPFARVAFVALVVALLYLRRYLKAHERRLLAEAQALSASQRDGEICEG
jgi:membrane protein DedA with SNARE-associated domain